METRKTPILRSKSLLFPDAFCYQLEDGKKPALCGNSFTNTLLANIASFLQECPAIANEVQLYLLRWEAHFIFDRTYIIAGAIGLRFLPEQAIKLIFTEPGQAEDFLHHCLRSY